ncbi:MULTISPECIES: SseB family protein [Novipirellula]|uniref:SseB protein N-terminal domain-containing protein n=1 Tax=Novipirellula rosea TaxID=1031540 RepID=A0ABP8N3B7_9BACT|tara:strand:- start:642 stop:1049 length:408 start_codon:yes stop_codon:yes gene_type:complete
MTFQSHIQALDAAIAERNAKEIRSILLGLDFVLINIDDEDEGDGDEESMGALTAEIEDADVLVAFSSEENAGLFVGEMGDLFSEEDEVQGFVVDGETLLEFLPEGFGLLINPETEYKQIIDPELATEILELGEPA